MVLHALHRLLQTFSQSFCAASMLMHFVACWQIGNIKVCIQSVQLQNIAHPYQDPLQSLFQVYLKKCCWIGHPCPAHPLLPLVIRAGGS